MPDNTIILAGGSGFLGQALASHFTSLGWRVVVFTRRFTGRASPAIEVLWDGATLGPWATELEGAHTLINLTGRSVDCRYTPSNRRILIDSRILPTRVLGQAIALCKKPPLNWFNASSATIYRHTLEVGWDEKATDFAPTPEAKDAFSLEIIHAWEREFEAAPTPHTRKVALRTSMVLGHAANSVFPVLRRLTRLGLGGRMGSGRQFVSWLHERDFCRAIEWLVAHPELTGPVNICAPEPLTNAAMMQLFRRVVGIPFGLPAERWMLEIGAFFLRTETELILKSRRVLPGKLLSSGFTFEFPTFRSALEDLAMRTSDP